MPFTVKLASFSGWLANSYKCAFMMTLRLLVEVIFFWYAWNWTLEMYKIRSYLEYIWFHVEPNLIFGSPTKYMLWSFVYKERKSVSCQYEGTTKNVSWPVWFLPENHLNIYNFFMIIGDTHPDDSLSLVWGLFICHLKSNQIIVPNRMPSRYTPHCEPQPNLLVPWKHL